MQCMQPVISQLSDFDTIHSLWCAVSGGVTGPLYVPWPDQTADCTRVSHNSWWLTINSCLDVSVFSHYFMTNIAKLLSLLHHPSFHFCELNCWRRSFVCSESYRIFLIWTWLFLCFIISTYETAIIKVHFSVTETQRRTRLHGDEITKSWHSFRVL